MCPGFDSLDPASYVGWVCCWFSSLLRGFFFGFSGFPPSSKINISKFQLDREFAGHGFVSLIRLLCVTLVKQSLFFYFSIYFSWRTSPFLSTDWTAGGTAVSNVYGVFQSLGSRMGHFIYFRGELSGCLTHMCWNKQKNEAVSLKNVRQSVILTCFQLYDKMFSILRRFYARVGWNTPINFE